MAIEIYSDESTKVATSVDFEDLRLYEEINGAYTASFEVNSIEFEKFRNDYYVSGLQPFIVINGQKYTPASLKKDRGEQARISFELEHVSYLANNIFVYSYLDEKMTGSVEEIMEELISAVSLFSVGTIQFNEEIEYRPREDASLREMLFELARGVGGELHWDNYTVSLLQSRGTDKGLKLETGTNIEQLSAFFEREKSGQYWSYSVDFIDLSHVPGYEQFVSAELGDTVRLIDGELGIDSSERIVSIERDPFNKALPKVQIGRVVKNLFNYESEENDENEEEGEIAESLSLNFELDLNFETSLTGDFEDDDETGGVLKKNNVWTEWATVPFDPYITIYFSKKYRQMPAVNAQVFGSSSRPELNILTEEVNGQTLYTGVTIASSGNGSEVAMHAIGRV